jgi:hypothetical protein
VAFRYLADAAERAGHAATARDALRRYVALVHADALDAGIADRIARLDRRAG